MEAMSVCAIESMCFTLKPSQGNMEVGLLVDVEIKKGQNLFGFV